MISLTLDIFAFLEALFAVLEVVLVTTLSVVQELCANTIMRAVIETTNALLSLARIGLQLTVGRIESCAFRGPLTSGLGSGLRLDRLLLRTIALGLALMLLFEVVSVSFASSVVELTASRLGSVVVPTGRVILAWSQVRGQFASVLD